MVFDLSVHFSSWEGSFVYKDRRPGVGLRGNLHKDCYYSKGVCRSIVCGGWRKWCGLHAWPLLHPKTNLSFHYIYLTKTKTVGCTICKNLTIVSGHHQLPGSSQLRGEEEKEEQESQKDRTLPTTHLSWYLLSLYSTTTMVGLRWTWVIGFLIPLCFYRPWERDMLFQTHTPYKYLRVLDVNYRKGGCVSQQLHSFIPLWWFATSWRIHFLTVLAWLFSVSRLGLLHSNPFLLVLTHWEAVKFKLVLLLFKLSLDYCMQIKWVIFYGRILSYMIAGLFK